MSDSSSDRPGQRLGFVLYRMGKEVARAYEAQLAPLKIRPDQAGILTAVSYEGPMHIRGLSRLLGINRQSIVNATDSLEALGAVERKTDPSDSRLVLVTVTEQGRRLLEQLETRARSFDALLDSVGHPAQRASALAYLSELARSGLLGEAFEMLPQVAAEKETSA